MNLYPAIDLKDGQCVRLLRGEMDKATVFNDNPGAQAAAFADAGARWIHVVDLNGAFAGHPVNASAVESIIDAVTPRGVKVQLGGGIRTLERTAQWLERGLSRVILGTVALRDPELVKEACRRHPGKIAVGIDARDGFVAVEGWAEVSEMKAIDLALKFEDAGVAAIIYTDIARDGAMQGPNLDATAALAEALTTPVILSGGVSSYDDLRAARARAASGIEGVITGRAVYDGSIDPAEAMKILAGEG
ncbi:MAG: 1-(5-phosphoribosyl)-5-[(5-phosphoribosylamino)methylideneamino]imidazole-4-carboxamide isomerase [Rhodospirillales bacterium]|nr:1-(5-phosphoribosyl)-5-[(5-phosphoribosylamino)methylideneamino]imidazole-4-carboxamide isomerase [Rhodospirillales bacterium]